MKFYEFSDFSYYAFIGADTEEKAIEYYKGNVADIEDEEDLEPTEMTRQEAITQYVGCLKENDDRSEEELRKEFEKLSEESPCLLLIDGSLI